jgi:hypothetical protein
MSAVCWNAVVTTLQHSPAQLARLLRLPEPTPEQAAVIAAQLGPVAVVAGAGTGKSETMRPLVPHGGPGTDDRQRRFASSS